MKPTPSPVDCGKENKMIKITICFKQNTNRQTMMLPAVPSEGDHIHTEFGKVVVISRTFNANDKGTIVTVGI